MHDYTEMRKSHGYLVNQTLDSPILVFEFPGTFRNLRGFRTDSDLRRGVLPVASSLYFARRDVGGTSVSQA